MERRQFSRIVYSAPVEIRQGSRQWQSQLLDLSLKGALVSRPSDFDGDMDASFLVTFQLEGMPNTILIDGTVVHEKDQQMGIRCNLMDIDSASHLRRLIEMNVGDEELLHRDIDALIAHKQ